MDTKGRYRVVHFESQIAREGEVSYDDEGGRVFDGTKEETQRCVGRPSLLAVRLCIH